jgi:hypothetical protein
MEMGLPLNPVDGQNFENKVYNATLGAWEDIPAQSRDADLTGISTLAGDYGFLKKNGHDVWQLDTNTYLTGNENITVTGDATGSGTTAIALTLANSGVSAGTYRGVTVDAKGRVTAGTNPTTIAGYSITDAYTKVQVDSLLTGLDMKQSCRVATTANIVLSGAQVIDGISVGAGDRVLAKDQSNAVENGIYVAAAGAWGRASDADNTPSSEVSTGMYTFIEAGTLNNNSGWTLLTSGTIILGTTPLAFTQFNGLGHITATAADITLAGNNISLPNVATSGTFTKVTIDTKGRVTSGTTLAAGDIPTLNQSTTGNAATATKLQTARTIALSGKVTGTATSFDGSAAITISVTGAGILSSEVTDATSGNSGNMIVKRDGSGNFNAGTISASLAGTATAATYLYPSGTASNGNTQFSDTPAHRVSFIEANGSTNAPNAGWGFYETYRHSNATNIWGTQYFHGWEDNANRMWKRNVSGGTYTGWVEFITSGNIGSQSVNYATTAGSAAANGGTSTSTNQVRGVNFHADATAPSGATRLNCDGYLYATRVYNAVYNDLAEFFAKAEASEAGDVVIQTDLGVIKSNQRAARAVVGVHSDSFGYALGAEDADNKTPVGLAGRVWVKVREPLEIGDLLVSDVDGFASKATPAEENIRGVILGKVMKTKTDSEVSRIEILILN